MHVTFAPKGRLQIDDATIVWRNFAGAASKYNREGDRNFCLVVPNQEIADALVENGWNVKIKPPREDGDSPFMYLKVKVAFNERGPAVYLQTGKNMHRLSEDEVHRLDRIDILSVDLDIRPYDWEVNGRTGRSAYLESIKVVQNVDRFATEYAEAEYPRDDEDERLPW